MTDRIVLDRSPQILRIEVPVDRDWTWDGEARGAVDPVLTSRIPDDVAFVSAAVLAEKAKQFGDGLYACMERSSQTGMGAFGGKSALLRSLAARLAGDPVGEAVAVVLGATELGGGRIDLRPEARSAVDDLVRRFHDDGSARTRSPSTRGFPTCARSSSRTASCRRP